MFFRNLLPENLVQATVQQYRTVLVYPGDAAFNDSGQLRDPNDLYTWEMGGEYTSGTNILGLVFFAGEEHCVEPTTVYTAYCQYRAVNDLRLCLKTKLPTMSPVRAELFHLAA